MKRLKPEKLHTAFVEPVRAGILLLPRCYTLTHSDITGELFLSIGRQHNTGQISGLYTKLMRDEVLAELAGAGNEYVLDVYCHVSGGLVLGTARFRYKIFHSELPLVIEAIRYGDKDLYDNNSFLDKAGIKIHFQSKSKEYNKVENWGSVSDYA